MRRLFLIALGILILTGSPEAQDSDQMRRLTTGDDSRGWEGVGRLNIGGNSFCTGALIAPDLVLTAAHCLFDRDTGRRYRAQEIEFLADWRNGRASAYANVARAVPHPNFRLYDDASPTRVAYDIALLRLQHPIRKSSIEPFELADSPRKGESVGVVSYAAERADSPTLEEDCRVLARQGGSLVLSCDVDFGSSGSPIFRIENGEARIVSVISAKAEVRGRKVSLGTSLEEPLQLLQLMLAQSDEVFTHEKPKVRRLSMEESRRETGGAKFLRP